MKFPDGKNLTPQSIVAGFVLFIEGVAGLASTQVQGNSQQILIFFVVFFPVLVFVCFVIILWQKPWVLYSPSEYSNPTSPQEFIPALRNDNANLTARETVQLQSNALLETQDVELKSGEVLQDDHVIEEPSWVDYFVDGDYEGAYRTISLRIADASGDQSVLRPWASYLLSFFDFQQAINEASLAVNAFPKNSLPYYMFSLIYTKAKLETEALNIIDVGLKQVEPEQSDSLFLQKAEIFRNQKNYSNQQDVLQKMLSMNFTPSVRSQVFRQLARSFVLEEKKEDAKSAAIQAYKTEPLESENLREIAAIFSELDEHRTELFFRKKETEVKPSASAWTYLGNCYLLLELNSLAISAYRAGDELADGKQAWILGNIGNLMNNRGFYSWAIEKFRKALELDPHNQYSHERLASALKNQADEMDKEKEIIQNIKLDDKATITTK